MKICACVITYYPDVRLLRQNVEAFQASVDRVFIWQNTPIAERSSYSLPQWSNSTNMGEDANLGISAVLNKMLRLCHDEGYTHLLTMDQDSVFSDFPSYFADAKQAFESDPELIETGPEVNESVITPHRLSFANYIITSGAIVDVEKALSIGGYREEFVVDGIDIDFGFRANKSGFKVCQIGGAVLTQNYGESLAIGRKKVISYSSQRLYNTVRSQIILWREYPGFFHKKLFLSIYYIKFPINIILFQKDKTAKLKAIIKGTWDGTRH